MLNLYVYVYVYMYVRKKILKVKLEQKYKIKLRQKLKTFLAKRKEKNIKIIKNIIEQERKMKKENIKTKIKIKK